MVSIRAVLVWTCLVAAITGPIVIAAMSPLLAWRNAIYIASGFAGIIALVLVLIQPLLAGGILPGLPIRSGRRLHRWVGGLLVAMVVAHVAGLWITSPPDVIDALLFVSPTPFSPWGVIAMWATFAAAAMAAIRGFVRLRPRSWRIGHTVLVTVVVIGSVVHALLIEGTMGTLSKAVLCFLVLAVTAKVVTALRPWAQLVGRKT